MNREQGSASLTSSCIAVLSGFWIKPRIALTNFCSEVWRSITFLDFAMPYSITQSIYYIKWYVPEIIQKFCISLRLRHINVYDGILSSRLLLYAPYRWSFAPSIIQYIIKNQRLFDVIALVIYCLQWLRYKSRPLSRKMIWQAYPVLGESSLVYKHYSSISWFAIQNINASTFDIIDNISKYKHRKIQSFKLCACCA
jgi:hypothetical protein